MKTAIRRIAGPGVPGDRADRLEPGVPVGVLHRRPRSPSSKSVLEWRRHRPVAVRLNAPRPVERQMPSSARPGRRPLEARTVEVGAALGRADHQHGVLPPLRHEATPRSIPASPPSRSCRPSPADVPRHLDWDQQLRATTSQSLQALRRGCANQAGVADGPSSRIRPRYLANTDGALRLLEHVGSPAMGINFDPSHTFPVGDFPKRLGLSARRPHQAPPRLRQ